MLCFIYDIFYFCFIYDNFMFYFDNVLCFIYDNSLRMDGLLVGKIILLEKTDINNLIQCRGKRCHHEHILAYLSSHQVLNS